jgi:hypothetical protein
VNWVAVVMSGLPPLATELRTSTFGSFVPIGDIAWWLNEYSVLRRETTAAHPWISSLVSRLILVDPRGYEGTDEAQHENAGSRYNDQVN